jgi:hypothetical protein
LLLTLVACVEPTSTPPANNGQAPPPPPTKGFPAPGPAQPTEPARPEIRDSVYLPVDRTAPPPAGYGLYTVLVTRSANRNTARVLSILFNTSDSAGQAAIARQNLNLIVIPVKNVSPAAQVLAAARGQPDTTADEVMRKFYDFGAAAKMLASVCRPDRGAAVMKACGSQEPTGPLLVTTTQRPLSGIVAPNERMLIVNLSSTQPEAVPEVVAAYRRQILREDFNDQPAVEGWRLAALNTLLEAAHLLPGISKAYAETK